MVRWQAGTNGVDSNGSAMGPVKRPAVQVRHGFDEKLIARHAVEDRERNLCDACSRKSGQALTWFVLFHRPMVA